MKRTSSRIASRVENSATPATASVVKSAKRKAAERNRVGENGDATTATSKKAWTCKEKEQLIAGMPRNLHS